MDGSGVALVIPALNESASIGPVVQKARRFGTVIVVDDGSTDDTGGIARTFGAEVVRHTKNLGYDAALQSGFERAAALGATSVITLDADGQHNPELIEKFILQLQQGADLVLGVRNTRPRFAEHVFAWYTRWFYGIHDPLCGMKGYRMEIYHQRGCFDSHQSIGTELMLFAARRGYRIVQLPFIVGERQGLPRFGRLFSANLRIMKALWRGLWIKS